MLKGDYLVHIKQLYNCKWYKRLYYKFYNFWQLLNFKNKQSVTIYFCYKGKELSSEMLYAPYILITSDDLKNKLRNLNNE